MNKMTLVRTSVVGVITLLLFSCRESGKPAAKDIVNEPQQLEKRINQHMRELLDYAAGNFGKLNDSTVVSNTQMLQGIYAKNNFAPIWSESGSFNVIGDSLSAFIAEAKNFGLFPSDYHFRSLHSIKSQLQNDSLARRDAALLSRTDVMLTDALLSISKHLKRGRLPYDSLTMRADTIVLTDNFFDSIVNQVRTNKQVYATLNNLEPKLSGYQQLKEGIKSFVDSVEFRNYTYLLYPYTDSAHFFTLLKNRLYEEKLFDSLPATLDTSALRRVLTSYQASKKLKPTGRINENTVKSLNNTPWEKFKRIAISLDKFKLMPDTMPQNYVWVNIPSYKLKVIDMDTLVMESRVIVGAAKTRTPEIKSEISNFITYPQWTVPYSIIFKEMLPQIQKDTNYLKKQNLMVVDKNDSVIPPSKIKWSKLSKNNFPYLIRQREGDDNSLGVLKFNFRNKYSVYLHDTNARWLFSKTDRAMSHGCVRVQNWQKLAFYLVRNDSIKYNKDTLTNWIARQEKHVVSGFKKVPVYIRYFTCEGGSGRVRFYEDIYAEDKLLAEKYFSKNTY